MVALRPESARPYRATVTVALLAGLLANVAVAAKKPAAEVILDAASSEFDYGSSNYLFRDVVITQGDIRVSANEARATGTDFNNAVWVFSGKVRIAMKSGSINSDSARIQFQNNVIASARVEGKPARFEQSRPGNSAPARGRAAIINYDVTTGVVTLTNEAWLSDGRNDISGNELLYSLKNQKVQAQSRPGTEERVRITIRPAATPPPPTGNKPQ